MIPLARPDGRVSFPGGSRATHGKFIHALDGFEEGCSLNSIACSGELPLTSSFSAMLFDFRRSAPCVMDLAVASARQGHPAGTMLCPFRAGRHAKVYANLFNEGQRHGKSTIAMVDFRSNNADRRGLSFQLPDPVDDFRCFGGSIYAACTEARVCAASGSRRLRVLRCSPGRPNDVESISTIVESYDSGGRGVHDEDLKVLSICQRGFAVSYGEHLALGTVAEPLRRRRLRLR